MRELIIKETGHGKAAVFTTRAFETGETISELTGRRRTLASHVIAVLMRRVRAEDALRIGANTIVDLEGLPVWCQDSRTSNATVKDGTLLVATRAIAPGETITLNRARFMSPMLPLSSGAEWAWPKILASGRYLLSRLVSKPAAEPIHDHSIFLPGGRTGIMLIHGLGGTPLEMRDLAEAFANEGYTVHCPQLAGHCGTYEDLKQPNWQDWAQSVEIGLNKLAQTTDRIIVSGLSAGAILALNAAARHPERVNGVILYAPTLWLNGWMVPPHAVLFNIVLQKPTANLFGFPDLPPHGIKDPAIRTRIKAALNSGDASKAGLPVTPGGAVFEHRKLVRRVLARLNRIGQPVLIVHPREDDYADLNNISHLHRHLPGLVEIASLNDSYHIVTVDRQRHIAIERSLEFMGRIAATPALGATLPSQPTRPAKAALLPTPASARPAPSPPAAG